MWNSEINLIKQAHEDNTFKHTIDLVEFNQLQREFKDLKLHKQEDNPLCKWFMEIKH